MPSAPPWNETITFALTNFATVNTIGNSGIDTFDGNGANNTVNRPASSTININDFTGVPYFLDPTPMDNSEFGMSVGTAALGGGTLTNKVFGNATAAGAQNRWDMLTLILHETEHSLGISSGSQRFLTLAGPSTNVTRNLTITNALSGLPNNFDIPIVGQTISGTTTNRGTAHYIGAATNGDVFGFSVVAEPGWGESQRALPTCLDILGIGQVEGATAAQINCALVPEPSTWLLLATSLAGLLGYGRRRRKFVE